VVLNSGFASPTTFEEVEQLITEDLADLVAVGRPFLANPDLAERWRRGAELNEAQGLVDNYLRENDLPGIRMLVVHQFKPTMIRDSQVVRAEYDRVVLVHTADGFGSPPLKRNTYATNARSLNMPVKGFKLFFESKVVGAGWDKPLMKPEEVLALDPMPMVVMYQ